MSTIQAYRPTAFISYRAAGSDLETAVTLRDALKKNQVSVSAWRDKDDLIIGSDNLREIERGIAGADYFIQLLSAASVDSKWCQRERIFAMENDRRIIPVKLEADVKVPLEIIELQYLKMLHGVPQGLPAILKAMGVDVREPANPDPLDRDDKRMRALAQMCAVMVHSKFPVFQVMTALVMPTAVAGLETAGALNVVKEVERLNNERRFRDSREMGQELIRLWDNAG